MPDVPSTITGPPTRPTFPASCTTHDSRQMTIFHPPFYRRRAPSYPASCVLPPPPERGWTLAFPVPCMVHDRTLVILTATLHLIAPRPTSMSSRRLRIPIMHPLDAMPSSSGDVKSGLLCSAELLVCYAVCGVITAVLLRPLSCRTRLV
ncbi:hypothetical protein C8T65DRAFT_11908 [Cerioporus squamosus]|nr:hypothetical protein C8T65DRAFT_11908 [Cerioporus squamosus]